MVVSLVPFGIRNRNNPIPLVLMSPRILILIHQVVAGAGAHLADAFSKGNKSESREDLQVDQHIEGGRLKPLVCECKFLLDLMV